MNNTDELMQELNNIANEMLRGNTTRTKGKGTATYYTKGYINDKTRVCYTRAKTYYKGRFGFWSWIQTAYNNGKTKRVKFAKSGNRAKCETRAIKLLEKATALKNKPHNNPTIAESNKVNIKPLTNEVYNTKENDITKEEQEADDFINEQTDINKGVNNP